MINYSRYSSYQLTIIVNEEELYFSIIIEWIFIRIEKLFLLHSKRRNPILIIFIKAVREFQKFFFSLFCVNNRN